MRNYTIIGLLLIVMAVLFIPATIVHAATLTVDDPTGTVGANGLCSLPEAIIAANGDADFNDCVGAGAYGADTITLATNVTLDGTTLYTYIEGDTGLPDITSQITIEGAGFTISRAIGATPFRFFNITAAGDLTLNNVTLSGGYALGANATCNGNCSISGDNGSGGAVFNQGTLTITNSTLSGNGAQGGTATTTCAPLGVCAANGGDGRGGAIYTNGGTTTITDSTLTQNAALNSTATCTGGNICFATTGDGRGGAMFSESSNVSVNTSTLSSNSSQQLGGAIYNQSTNLAIDDSMIYSNSATSSGGAIHNLATGTVNMTSSTLYGNSAGTTGGAIHNIGTTNMTNSTISTNASGAGGGGLWNSDTININNTTVYNNNSASNAGDALQNSGTANIYSSILASNDAGADCSNTVPGTINTTFSIDADGTCGVAFTDTIAQIALGGIANNGGNTLTHKPATTSVVIDVGDCPAGTDQTGAIQPVDTSGAVTGAGNECEIGSVEVQAATVSFQIAASSVNESPGGAFDITVVLTVTSDIAPGTNISATITYAGGTATANSDYTGFTTLTADFGNGGFSAAVGTYTTTVSINVIDDLITELNETVVMTITNVANGGIGIIPTHTVTIIDNDIPTATPTPIPPPVATDTPVPTATFTTTATVTSTSTSTATATSTATSTATATATSTATSTATVTSTATLVPTDTPLPTTTFGITVTPSRNATREAELEQLETPSVFTSTTGSTVCIESGGETICQSNGVPPIVDIAGNPIIVSDVPFIQKVSDPPVAGPGAQVTFTLRVINPTGSSVSNVRVVDEVPASLTVESASASSGSVSVSGQTVTFTQGSLAAGGRITITIVTTIKSDNTDYQFINRACLTSSGNPIGVCGQAGFVRAGYLPLTGEPSPMRRLMPIIAGLSLIILLLSAALVSRRFGTL